MNECRDKLVYSIGHFNVQQEKNAKKIFCGIKGNCVYRYYTLKKNRIRSKIISIQINKQNFSL